MDARSDSRTSIDVDPRGDYSGIQPKRNHKWTIWQHITLTFLARSYENTWTDLTNVFNEHFSSELGNPDRLSSRALAFMYNDMKRGITGKDAMELLQTTAFSFNIEPTRVDQDSIERTATKLGIHLIKKLPGALSKGPKPPKKQRRAKRKAVVLEEDTDFLSERESTPRPPKKRQHPEPLPQTPDSHNNLGARNGLLTPPSTVSHQSVHAPKLPATISQPSVATPKWLPPVAYRAFSEKSQGSFSKEQGFRAGKFVESDLIPLPPDIESEEYINEAKRHVAPIPTGPTPFISTTTSIVRAIHRALKLGPNASICVLSLDLADAEGRVQSASALKLQHLVNHYYVPYNEFLIYGKIPPSAILSVLPISSLLADIPSMPSDADPFKIVILRDSKSLRSGRVALEKARLPLSYGLGYAVGRLAQRLGIPYVQTIWEYAITNLVVDFKFGQGLNRWNEWTDLNEIFRNAVEQGYQSQERNTLTDSGVIEGTSISRRIREGEVSDAGHLEHRGADEIPNDDSSTDDKASIRNLMSDIWKYVDIRPVHDVTTLRNLKVLGNPDSGLSSQLRAGEQSGRQGEAAHEGFNVGAVGYASPLNELRVYDGTNGRFAVRPKRVDTLPIRPPRQLLLNGKASIRDLSRSDCHKGVQVVPPSDQQGNHQTKKGESLYKYSWTGM